MFLEGPVAKFQRLDHVQYEDAMCNSTNRESCCRRTWTMVNIAAGRSDSDIHEFSLFSENKPQSINFSSLVPLQWLITGHLSPQKKCYSGLWHTQYRNSDPGIVFSIYADLIGLRHLDDAGGHNKSLLIGGPLLSLRMSVSVCGFSGLCSFSTT